MPSQLKFEFANQTAIDEDRFALHCLRTREKAGCAVNVTDLLLLLGAWGPNPVHVADINGDGNINVTDLLALLAAWGVCP